MTKSVRIENADTSTYTVIVEIWDKGQDGAPDTKVKEINLDHPTMMATDYLTSSRYMIVREAT